MKTFKVTLPRTAICGACGCERFVTMAMRRDPEQQFRARPEEKTDVFYCGCQNDDELELPAPGLGWDD